MNLAFILRGVSGSGKSTVASYLARGTGVIHSTDNLRYNEQGEYVFDPALKQAQHDQNFLAFCESLNQGIPVVICDNTNITKSEYQRYVDAALVAGYLVAIICLPHPDPKEAAERNIHSVPQEVIEAMIKRWEP